MSQAFNDIASIVDRQTMQIFRVMVNVAGLSILLLICAFGANGAVVQRPSADTQPLAAICKPSGSSVTNFTTPNTWQPELPPANFEVDIEYQNVRDLSKFDVWLSIVINIARIAVYAWDHVFPGLVFPTSNNIELKLRSSVKAPGYQTKSIIWTLRQVFYQYNGRAQYSSSTFVARIGDLVLGAGSIRSTLGSTVAAHSNASSSAALVNSLIAELSAKSQLLSGVSLKPATQLDRRGLDLRLSYTPNGALFTDGGIFTTVINLLMLTANHDPKTQSVYRTTLPNRAEGYVVEVAAINEEEEISLERIIQVLGALPGKMYEQRVGGRWAELKGVVRFDGVNVGRVRIEKGGSGGGAAFGGGGGGGLGSVRVLDYCQGF